MPLPFPATLPPWPARLGDQRASRQTPGAPLSFTQTFYSDGGSFIGGETHVCFQRSHKLVVLRFEISRVVSPTKPLPIRTDRYWINQFLKQQQQQGKSDKEHPTNTRDVSGRTPDVTTQSVCYDLNQHTRTANFVVNNFAIKISGSRFWRNT